MSEKTASGLIAYAEAQLGRPYWMGTFGQTASEYLYESNKKRLPKYYTASDFPKQFGKRVHDCAGLIKGYLWSDDANSVPHYLAPPLTKDLDANGFYYSCKQRNTISTMPETPGTLVFIYSAKTGKMEHIGVYIGNGYCIEAKGHAYGVVKTQFKGRGWTHWGICPFITYDVANTTEEKEDDEMTIEAINNMTDEQVDAFVTRLNQRLAKLPASEYAQKSCAKAVNSKLFSDGDNNGTLDNPRGFMLRQDLAVIMDRDGKLG